MPFVPTEKQIDSLYILLKQLAREYVEIRLIRFVRWAENGIKNCEVEIFCFEEEDKYRICYDGTIEQK